MPMPTTPTRTRTPSPTSTATPTGSLAVAVTVGVGLGVLVLVPVGVVGIGLEILVLFFVVLVVGGQCCRLYLGLDLVTEIGGVIGSVVGRKAMTTAEVAKFGCGNLELVGDPCVRAALADPGADLIQLCSE